MKKLLFTVTIIAFIGLSFSACEAEDLNNDINGTDKKESVGTTSSGGEDYDNGED